MTLTFSRRLQRTLLVRSVMLVGLTWWSVKWLLWKPENSSTYYCMYIRTYVLYCTQVFLICFCTEYMANSMSLVTSHIWESTHWRREKPWPGRLKHKELLQGDLWVLWLCWLVGRLVDWLVGRLRSWFAGWQPSWLAGWMVGWLAGWLVVWLIGWLAGWMVGWLAGWLAGWMVGWLVGCLDGWLIVLNCVVCSPCPLSVPQVSWL